jgi:hypothetical protein
LCSCVYQATVTSVHIEMFEYDRECEKWTEINANPMWQGSLRVWDRFLPNVETVEVSERQRQAKCGQTRLDDMDDARADAMDISDPSDRMPS